MKFTTKRNLVILVAIVIVFCMYRPTAKKEGFTVYGTTWCGYTTKQRDYLDKKYGRGSHKFVDCDKEDCQGLESFPMTVTKNGTKVTGFNETI